MKQEFFWLLLLLLPGLGVCSSDTIPPPVNIPYEYHSWEEFKSYDGRFRIITPGELTYHIDSIDTPVGRVAYHTYFFQTPEKESDNLLYMISYYDYPEYTVHSDSLEILDDFFETTMEAAASSVRGELVYSSEIDYKNYPGRIWRIDYLDGKAIIKTKAFLAGRRFYTIQTITLKQRSLNRSSDKFLDSFSLLE